jgi:hypothetical protein
MLSLHVCVSEMLRYDAFIACTIALTFANFLALFVCHLCMHCCADWREFLTEDDGGVGSAGISRSEPYIRDKSDLHT